MREFFKGWRRKVGALMLVMACVAMLGWVRSFPFDEAVWFPTGKRSYSGLISQSGFLVWVSFHHEADAQRAPDFFDWQSQASLGTTPFEDYSTWKVLWNWNEFSSISNESPGEQQTRWIAPYWSIVLPVTLIAAYLLLSKPSEATQKKFIEPISDEGA